uniref:Ubiquilin n=1 Tax=Leptocylindrus danicus TaxID=163516 RepID=A0A7S2NZK6_9STRA|mmetsp:Transcript_19961/g.29736  ORF Transcript_19961/g.29736 Transcript_19961/m.29736 type:complete len:518 (+) Transcript_19961:134-1687(+)|eukprot:CAMPEP_0116034074 /NCGR_PEP_ID=MMETSP0321-20121206/19380_1 /TAXON_ID=163516 /ORGANISM="Leptocylindrus danicus var. danicus, Strain B650" /LENGTH=517 /DNA_ID=CAMNT_0003510295 /DNA_START=123 /DNA_END=1676 /DNA_ORIENTATION=-
MSSNSDITVNIRLNSTVRFTLPSCTLQTTLGQVKEMISELEASGRVEPSRQRIIFKGRVLREDAQTLAEVGFEDNQTLHLVKGAAAASASSSSNNDAPSTTTANPASTNTTNMGGMPGMMGMGGGGMPSMEQMNATMQNPLFQNLMDNMLSNPETLTALMQTNPQMQQMMENNPQLRHALEDPAVLRQAMQAMRNPDYMQQMMRNQDLAMSQIENMPGGFNHLRRMYEDVQEPMMDAMSGSAAAAGSSGAGSGSGSSSSGSGANNNGTPGRGAMPNPWGAPSASTSTSTTGATNNNNNTAAATPFGNMGMGGAGMMPNMNMNLDQTISMLENPAIRSMMDSLTSDPETFRRMTEANPMFQQMVRDNPAMSSMMSNPQMMRSMLDPVNLRAMQQMQNAMQTLQQNNAVNPAMNMNPWGAAGNLAGAAPVSNTNATAAGSGLDFSNLLNPAAATASSSSSSSTPSMMNMPSVVPASTRYADQINALVNMGFADRDANARALEACGGNINRAVEWLLSRS